MIAIQSETGKIPARVEIFFSHYRFISDKLILATLAQPARHYHELKQLYTQLKADTCVNNVYPIAYDMRGYPVLLLNPISFSLKPHTNIAEVENLLKPLGVSSLSENQWVKNVYQCYLSKLSAYNTLEVAAYLHHSGLVDFAEPNYGVFVDACVNDPFFPRQWNIKNDGTPLQGNGIPDADMDVDSAWIITTGSPFIQIAILDSGVDTLHPDLAQNIAPGFDATGGNSKGYPNTRFGQDAHGTACAGIAAARANNGLGIAGIAFDCKIIPVKIFYYVDSVILGQILPYSEAQWMAAGISWAWQQARADVMSNSWGLPDFFLQLLPGNPVLVDSAIYQAYRAGRNGKGVAQFFSSGNDGGLPIWPARLPITIAVNATNMCDTRKDSTGCDNEPWEGNWGEGLDIGAPGVRIATTDLQGNKGFTTSDYVFTFNGTSAACPNAAAVAALLLTLRDDLTAEDIRFILGNSADKVGGYDYAVIKPAGPWSPYLGYGRVNAYKALQLAQTYSGNIEAARQATISHHHLLLYPNPTDNQLHIISPLSAIEQIELVDLTGKIIYKAIGHHQHHIILHLPSIHPGIYLCRIYRSDKLLILKKIVRQ